MNERLFNILITTALVCMSLKVGSLLDDRSKKAEKIKILEERIKIYEEKHEDQMRKMQGI